MLTDLFSVPIFLVVFRETLETAIIVSVLLAFLKQTLRRPGEEQQLHNTFRRQVCAAPDPTLRFFTPSFSFVLFSCFFCYFPNSFYSLLLPS